MITNIDDFVRYIPTARGTMFEDILPFLEDAELWIENEMFGEAIVAESISATASATFMRSYNSILALRAYSTAIPFLDVVQTANGFAVVSNNVKAPASKERVERLLAYVEDRLYNHVDILISLIQHDSDLLAKWKEFPKFEQLTGLLFWSGSEFDNIAGSYELLEDAESLSKTEKAKRRIPYLELRRLSSKIKGYQDQEIAAHISSNYLDELISKRRENTLTADDKNMINRLQYIIGLFLINESYKAKEQLKAIENILSKDLEKYATYASSQEYQLKITARYQNQLEDSTYFFG